MGYTILGQINRFECFSSRSVVNPRPFFVPKMSFQNFFHHRTKFGQFPLGLEKIVKITDLKAIKREATKSRRKVRNFDGDLVS